MVTTNEKYEGIVNKWDISDFKTIIPSWDIQHSKSDRNTHDIYGMGQEVLFWKIEKSQ